MDASSCPICRHGVTCIQVFDTSELAHQYKRQISVDVRGEFLNIDKICLNRCTDCDFIYFSPALNGSEGFYEKLQENSWYYLEEKPEFATARRHMRRTDRVLDIGCGSGAFAKYHPAGNYVGLEYTASSVAKAQAKKLSVFKQSIEQYAATAPEPFEVVCAFQVLEHVSDQRLFIRACADICRPGGKIIFSTPNADAFISAVKNCVLNFPPHHTAWFSRKLWANLTRYFPLRTVEIVEESLEPIHQPLYASTLVQAALERFLHMRSPPLIDGSLRNRILGKISRLGGRLLAGGLTDARLQPKGQSITVVYERI